MKWSRITTEGKIASVSGYRWRGWVALTYGSLQLLQQPPARASDTSLNIDPNPQIINITTPPPGLLEPTKMEMDGLEMGWRWGCPLHCTSCIRVYRFKGSAQRKAKVLAIPAAVDLRRTLKGMAQKGNNPFILIHACHPNYTAITITQLGNKHVQWSRTFIYNLFVINI